MDDLNPENTPDQSPPKRTKGVRNAMQRQQRLFRDRLIAQERVRVIVKEEFRQRRTKDAYHHCTPIERRFARIIATDPDCNRNEALRRAGFKARDAKQISAQATRLYKRPIVRAAIWELVSSELDAAKIEGAQVIREAAYLAFLPAHMIEGKPTWRDKIESQKLLAALLGLEDRTVLHRHEFSYATLVHNAARRGRERLTVDAKPAERPGDVSSGQREAVEADFAGGGGPGSPLAESP